MRYIRELFDNILVKVVSLTMAGLLWYVMAGEKTSEIGFPVPLELQNVPQGIEIVSGVPETVKVRVRASAAIIRQLNRTDIAVQIDMSESSPGERIYQINESTVKRPFGVSVVKISPTVIMLSIEKTERALIPIRVRTKGNPAKNFEVKEISSTPSRISVVGPRSKIGRIPSAYTETVSVEEEKQDIVRSSFVGIDEPLVRIDGTPMTMVNIIIREREISRIVENVRIDSPGVLQRVYPDQVRVEISGPVSEIESFERGMLQVEIDEKGRTGRRKARVVANIRSNRTNVVVKSIEPTMVMVK
jgi:YbbR domain-containing protein